MTTSQASQRSLIGWLSLGQLIGWGSVFYMFALIMGPVEQELQLSRVEVSVAFSLALLVEGLLGYPVGRWIDQGHERVVMTGGSVLTALCLAWLGSVQGRTGFFLAWCGLGVGMAATLYTPVFAVLTRRYPHDFRRAIITMTFLGGLASTVFIPLTAWMIAHWGWRGAMLGLAAMHLLLCAPLHAIVLRNAPAKIALPHAQTYRSAQATGLPDLLRGAPFLLVGFFMMLLTAVCAALPAHMVSLLRENHLPETWVIAIPASLGVIQVLGRLLLYFFEHHFDLHVANRLIPALIPLGIIALLAAPWAGAAQTAVVIVFVVLFGMGNGMLTIVKGTAIAQYVSHDHAATLNGSMGLPLALSRASAPLLMAWMWTPAVGYVHGLWVMVIASLAGVVALAWAQQHAARLDAAPGGSRTD